MKGAPVVAVERCEVCQERGVIQGIFHKMECAACNGGGFVRVGGTALEYPELVRQLRLRMAAATQERDRFKALLDKAGLLVEGPAALYGGNNNKGAGHSHYTGD